MIKKVLKIFAIITAVTIFLIACNGDNSAKPDEIEDNISVKEREIHFSFKGLFFLYQLRGSCGIYHEAYGRSRL